MKQLRSLMVDCCFAEIIVGKKKEQLSHQRLILEKFKYYVS